MSGLLVLRHLKGKPGINRIIAYEKNPIFGGQWAYTDQTGPDVVSSAYRDL